ncbi:MAG: hypothetical protein JNN32_04020 [Flavobacteriales bacterium]|nr:hypothetical protein [Flavobacteriales bacterium]
MRSCSAFAFLVAAATSVGQPGTLDASFGANGLAIAAVTGNYSSGEAIAEQPDGKIVVGGATPGYALLARFNADGTLDSGFGNNGLVLTDVDASNDFVGAVAVQPNGNIIAGGVRFNALADGRAIVMRHLPDGDLDASFGTNGIRTIDFTGTTDSFIKGLVLQPDGRIVACGERYTGTAWESFVLRLNSDGTTDSGFGIVQMDISTDGDDNATDITLQNDGKIVVCGTSESITGGGMFIARLNANGTFDGTFGTGGKLVLDIGGGGTDAGNSVRVQDDGKVIVCGLLDTQDGYRIGVARMLENGTLDNTFGTNGSVAINLGVDDWALPTLAVQPDGKILVGADNNTGNPARVKVIRLLSDGSLDASFGINGIGTSNATSGNDFEYAVRTLFLSDGGIAVAGYVDTPNNVQVAAWKFQSGLNVGISEGSGEGSFRIVPNPVHDELWIDRVAMSTANITIRELTGREVLGWSNHSARSIDVSALPPGTYSLSIAGSIGQRSARFIKR